MPSESDAPGDGTVAERSDEPGTEAVEWGPVRYDRLRSVLAGVGAVLVVAIAAFVTLFVVRFSAAIVSAALAGTLPTPSGSVWVLVLLLLVGGPLSLVYVLIGLDRSTPKGRSSLYKGFDGFRAIPRDLRPGWTVAGAAALGAVWWGGPSWLVTSLWLLFPMIWFVPLIAGYRGTTVRLAPVDRTVERTVVSSDRTATDDLDAVVRTRRIDLPWTTVFVLAFRGTEWYRSTPWLFVPTARADEVERALAAALSRNDGPDRAGVPQRVVLALVGGSALFVGLALALAADESAGWALALVASPISLLFFALAARL